MVNYFHLGAIILAAIAVAIADALIKKTSLSGSFLLAIKSPWMIAVIGLYLLQIFFFIYVFMNNWDLGIVGNLQMVFFSLSVILLGFFAFGETLSTIQFLGIGLALVGVILMNL